MLIAYEIKSFVYIAARVGCDSRVCTAEIITRNTWRGGFILLVPKKEKESKWEEKNENETTLGGGRIFTRVGKVYARIFASSLHFLSLPLALFSFSMQHDFIYLERPPYSRGWGKRIKEKIEK